MSINVDTFSFMSLSLSPDRQFLLSSSLPTNDICEISLWHIDSGNCIHTWRTKNAPVSPKGVFCANRNYSINYINKEGINFNQYEWVYSFPGWSEWDDAALETVQHFLRIHPDPTITDIDDLIFELQNKGLGWILREGVEKKISELKPKKPLVAAPKEKLFHRVFKKGSK